MAGQAPSRRRLSTITPAKPPPSANQRRRPRSSLTFSLSPKTHGSPPAHPSGGATHPSGSSPFSLPPSSPTSGSAWVCLLPVPGCFASPSHTHHSHTHATAANSRYPTVRLLLLLLLRRLVSPSTTSSINQSSTVASPAASAYRIARLRNSNLRCSALLCHSQHGIRERRAELQPAPTRRSPHRHRHRHHQPRRQRPRPTTSITATPEDSG